MAKGTLTNSTDTGTPGSYEPDTDFILQTIWRVRGCDYPILHVRKLRHRQTGICPGSHSRKWWDWTSNWGGPELTLFSPTLSQRPGGTHLRGGPARGQGA